MKPCFFAIFQLFWIACCNPVSAQIVLNGDLEKVDPATKLPLGWDNFQGANHSYKLDSTIVQHGKYSVCITSGENAPFGIIYYVVPHQFKAHTLQLKGFIKTENIIGGFASLWMRIDDNSPSANMSGQNLHGTTDWKEYTITLPYKSDVATHVCIGALLTGKGKMWFDNVRLYVDGVPVEKLKSSDLDAFKAINDTAFSRKSGINITTVNDIQIKNLTLLGQVWGFVKYHLPAVAKGNINMDAELFRVMPAILKAQNNMEASDAIEQWVDKLGTPEQCTTCNFYNDKNVMQKPDYGEVFNRSVVSESLVNKLTYILNNRNIGQNYYIGMVNNLGNPDFKHELAYSNMVYPDAGYRLLCLFRYWNMIQYFYPYKHLTGSDWNTVLTDFIRIFSEARDATEYELAVMKLISSIHDTHGNIRSILKPLENYRGKYAPPFQAKFVEDKLVVTDYYNDTLAVKDKIKIGDIITSINGATVTELIKKFLPITAASNYTTQLRDMPRNYLLRSNNLNFEFKVIRDGKVLTVNVDGIDFTNIDFKDKYLAAANLPGYKLINAQIGYVYSGKYYNKDLPSIRRLFSNTKGVIVDMRCYPSEFMPFTFVPYIKIGNAPFVKFTKFDADNPGSFKIEAPQEIKPLNEYKGKVVVIVNEETQSQAEYTTMAFQSSANVTVIGSTTAGADGDISQILLPGGISTAISGLDLLYPDGTETQRVGIKIDETVKPTIAGIKAGKDELLDRAIAIINKN